MSAESEGQGEWVNGSVGRQIAEVSALLGRIALGCEEDGGLSVLTSAFADVLGRGSAALGDDEFEQDLRTLVEAIRQIRAYEQSQMAVKV